MPGVLVSNGMIYNDVLKCRMNGGGPPLKKLALFWAKFIIGAVAQVIAATIWVILLAQPPIIQVRRS
jgi:hypothetical protein